MTARHSPAARSFGFRALWIAVLVAGGLSLAVYGLLHRDGDDERRQVVAEYLDAVVAGDNAAAWEVACSAERGRGPESSWSPVEDRPLAAYVITSVDSSTGNVKVPATHVATVAVTYRGDPEGTPPVVRKIEITKESGDWKACPRTPL